MKLNLSKLLFAGALFTSVSFAASEPKAYEIAKAADELQRNFKDEKTKSTMRILHPLPRVNEIATDVDQNAKAYYFEQAQNGVFTRQAIIANMLGCL